MDNMKKHYKDKLRRIRIYKKDYTIETSRKIIKRKINFTKVFKNNEF
jgi:hypothetical protein